MRPVSLFVRCVCPLPYTPVAGAPKALSIARNSRARGLEALVPEQGVEP